MLDALIYIGSYESCIYYFSTNRLLIYAFCYILTVHCVFETGVSTSGPIIDHELCDRGILSQFFPY